MGMKAIKAKQEEISKKRKVREEFVRIADDLKKDLEKIEKGIRQLEADRARIAKDIAGLDTFGIKEFVDYKESLTWISRVSSEHFVQLIKVCARPLPTAPLDNVLKGMQAEVKKMVDEWVDKQTAKFPKELKVGMTLKGRSGELVEILKMDKTYCDVKVSYQGKERNENKIIAVLSPQYGYKYIAV